MKTRTYKDINGNERKLKFVRDKGWLVEYAKGKYGKAEEWEDDSGSLIQIPSTVWTLLGITYTDKEIE